MHERITGEHSHPEGLTSAQESLSLALFEIGAVRFGDFRLKLHEAHPEAPLSPVYIDLRMLRRVPEAKRSALSVYEELLDPLEFDLLADIPTAATPFVSSLSDRLGIGQITPRTDAKSHGSGAKVDGILPGDKGGVAVLIDDLVTGADSKIAAAEALKAQGVRVHDIVVLIDREQGGRELLREADYELHNAFTMKQMLDFALRSGVITQDVLTGIIARLQLLNAYLKQ